MAIKAVISNPEDGKSYNVEVDGANEKRLKGNRIGDSVKGDIFGLTGYEVEVTGGSSKAGFPMKKGVDGIGCKDILISGGVGYKNKSKVRRKKRVHVEKIDDDIIQVNLKVVKTGAKSLDDLLGKKEEGEEEAKE